MRLKLAILPATLVTLTAAAFMGARAQQQDSTPPANAKATVAAAGGLSAKDPATLPFHDTHQGFTVAAEPLLKADEYKARFGKKTPYDTGIVAIEAYFRNDSAKPVQVSLEDIRLTVAAEGQEQQDLEPLSSKEVASDTLHEGGKAPGTRKLPPIPGVGNKHGKDWEELEVRLRSAQVPSDLVGPHATVHGLLYFDIDSRFDLIGVCRLYVPNLKFYASDQALLYFDVPLGATKSQ